MPKYLMAPRMTDWTDF